MEARATTELYGIVGGSELRKREGKAKGVSVAESRTALVTNAISFSLSPYYRAFKLRLPENEKRNERALNKTISI